MSESATTASSARVAAIINPSTRGLADRLIGALEAARPPDVMLDIYRTTQPGQAIRLARLAAATASVVVAVGGDGTVAEVATGIAGTGSVLGILPAGSTNITAQELAIPTEIEQAASLIFSAHRLAPIDLGHCGDRCFLHMAGAGIDSRFFARTSRALKRKVGWLAYIPAATSALRHPPAQFAISVDDRALEVRSALVLVANGAAVITPLLRIHPRVEAHDGWLDVLVFTATEPLAIARTVWHFVRGSLATSPYVVHLRGTSIRLETVPTLPVQLDGDVVTSTPATFGISPAALEVIVPANSPISACSI